MVAKTRVVQAVGADSVPLFDITQTVPNGDVNVWDEVIRPANNMGFWGMAFGIGMSAFVSHLTHFGMVECVVFCAGAGGGVFSFGTFVIMLSPYQDRCVTLHTSTPTLIEDVYDDEPVMPAFPVHDPVVVAPVPARPVPQGKHLMHPDDHYVFFPEALIAQLRDHALDELGNVKEWYFSRDGVWVNLPAFRDGRNVDQMKIAYSEMKECLAHSGLCRPDRQRTMWTEAGIKWLKEAV